jgi:hypothetical protein
VEGRIWLGVEVVSASIDGTEQARLQRRSRS